MSACLKGILENEEQENKTILKHVDNVLKHRSKRSLAKLNDPKLMRYFANILKKICGIKF